MISFCSSPRPVMEFLVCAVLRLRREAGKGAAGWLWGAAAAGLRRNPLNLNWFAPA